MPLHFCPKSTSAISAAVSLGPTRLLAPGSAFHVVLNQQQVTSCRKSARSRTPMNSAASAGRTRTGFRVHAQANLVSYRALAGSRSAAADG